jgi:hypothetical protein
VRVLRLIQFQGDRDWVESQLLKSIHGTVILPKGKITVVTIGEFPETIQAEVDLKKQATVDQASRIFRTGAELPDRWRGMVEGVYNDEEDTSVY